MAIQLELFEDIDTGVKNIENPKGYKNFYAFHKYWGKKPSETITYLITNLSKKGDMVFDPFMGYGSTIIEGARLKRKVLGVDLNPVITEIAKLLLFPQTVREIEGSFIGIEKKVKNQINKSYKIADSDFIASHFLWDDKKMLEIWTKDRNNHRKKIVIQPTNTDLTLSEEFVEYKLKYLDTGTFFQNSRINSFSDMTLYDLFTGRSLRNIELLLEAIYELPPKNQMSMLLCLTAASGQMSKMVFAIRNRKKNKKKKVEKTEVGSWVIGYWRPKLHFEINVWNCFERRVKKLIRALINSKYKEHKKLTSDLNEFFEEEKEICIVNDNCLVIMESMQDCSVDLILTDPPHSDRIPYLELSSMWNTLLNKNVNFEDEIGVSNAKNRNKSKEQYAKDMIRFVQYSARVLKENGILALMFNARDKSSWIYFNELLKNEADIGLKYFGYFPVKYSATSVIQDQRKGSLKDLTLIFAKTKDLNRTHAHSLSRINGWSENLPVRNGGNQ